MNRFVIIAILLSNQILSILYSIRRLFMNEKRVAAQCTPTERQITKQKLDDFYIYMLFVSSRKNPTIIYCVRFSLAHFNKLREFHQINLNFFFSLSFFCVGSGLVNFHLPISGYRIHQHHIYHNKP